MSDTNGKLVPQPLAEHGRNISDQDKIDSKRTVEIRPAEPTNCPGKDVCKGCRECNPVPGPYKSSSL